MSQTTIFDRSLEIRNETEQYANTRGRVANVLDDINETKANKVDVDLAIQELSEELELLSLAITELQEADVQHDLELEALRQKDISQDGDIQTLFANDLTLSNQISQEILDRQAGDDALTTALGFKLDKPTALADGSYALVKTGAAFSWESTATLGKNIFNSNLTLDADRTQNLGAKKLTFTGGRFSVPTLEMEITSPNSVPNKIWTDASDLWYTDSSGIQWKSLMQGKTFEHNVRGKRVEATISGTYNIDLNTGSHFALTASAATTIAFTNMILAAETCAITMTVTGALLTLPAWLIRDSYSDVPDASKTREYSIVIKRGGESPMGRYNVINI